MSSQHIEMCLYALYTQLVLHPHPVFCYYYYNFCRDDDSSVTGVDELDRYKLESNLKSVTDTVGKVPFLHELVQSSVHTF